MSKPHKIYTSHVQLMNDHQRERFEPIIMKQKVSDIGPITELHMSGAARQELEQAYLKLAWYRLVITQITDREGPPVIERYLFPHKVVE